MRRYFATCGKGIEPILARELDRLGASEIEPGRGGVRFSGDRALLYRANLWLRTAVRVLWPLLEAPVASPDELYDAVRTIDWSQWMTPDHTLAVDCNVRDSRITHSQYAARRVKDAICDQFIDKCGRRPSVDVEAPMFGFNLHVYRDHATLSLDSSGDSLHKRGYRPVQTKAPLNEALAAAIVQLTGWDGTVPFVDPLAGGGTLAIEAAWLALRRPPGLTRKRFGFMGWMDFDIGEWAEIRDEARRGVKKTLPAPIWGADARNDAVALAEMNAKAAGVGNLVKFRRQDVTQWAPEGPPGVIVTNPPYGERIGEEEELVGLYAALGEMWARRAPGWEMWIFTGNPRLAAAIGHEPAEKVPLYNGKIECRLLRFAHSRGSSP